MSDAFDIVSGGSRIRVQGLRTTVRALEKTGADAQDMRDLMHDIGNIVVHSANAPVLSGRLESSIRAGKGKTKAVVRAGGARVPYAGVIHYGWPARNIAPQPFISAALASERGAVFERLQEGLEEIQRRNNLI
jgi:hypothetical protein